MICVFSPQCSSTGVAVTNNVLVMMLMLVMKVMTLMFVMVETWCLSNSSNTCLLMTMGFVRTRVKILMLVTW